MGRVEEIETGHYEGYEPHCGRCGGDWPCDTAYLLDKVKRLREALGAVGDTRDNTRQMLSLMAKWGTVLPEMKGLSREEAWEADSYGWAGDYEEDARYNYPNKMRLIRTFRDAAISDEGSET